MQIADRLPQQLLLAVAEHAAGWHRACALVADLRAQGVPALLAVPESCAQEADLRLHPHSAAQALKHLQPSLVLICDSSAFARNLLLGARVAGMRTGLWLPLGQRAPWWARWSHLQVPCYQGADALQNVPEVARYLRAEVLGLGAGVECLILNPLGRAAARVP